MPTYDKTFCSNESCPQEYACERHLMNLKGYHPWVSLSDLTNTIYCLMKEKEKTKNATKRL